MTSSISIQLKLWCHDIKFSIYAVCLYPLLKYTASIIFYSNLFYSSSQRRVTAPRDPGIAAAAKAGLITTFMTDGDNQRRYSQPFAIFILVVYRPLWSRHNLQLWRRPCPLILRRPRTVPDWQPRLLLGMVEARSVNVKHTHTH